MHDHAPDTDAAAARDGCDVRSLLASHDIRATQQRVVVLEALMGERWDTSARRLHERLRPVHPTLGLATVYRTLDSLAEAGVIHRLSHGSEACYRFCQPGHHHHLTCTRCHKVVELRGCEVSEWAARQAVSHGFAQVEHVVELTGVCADCAG